MERFALPNLVVDLVAASKHGDPLLRPDAVTALRERLALLATVITPNLGEVKPSVASRSATATTCAAASGTSWDRDGCWSRAATWLKRRRRRPALGDGGEAVELTAPRLATRHTHGTGCTLASAIAANPADGLEVPAAVEAAKYATCRGRSPAASCWARASA